MRDVLRNRFAGTFKELLLIFSLITPVSFIWKFPLIITNLFLQTLLQQGRADANALGRSSCTPLHLAAEMDNEEICKILVKSRHALLLRYKRRVIENEMHYNCMVKRKSSFKWPL